MDEAGVARTSPQAVTEAAAARAGVCPRLLSLYLLAVRELAASGLSPEEAEALLHPVGPRLLVGAVTRDVPKPDDTIDGLAWRAWRLGLALRRLRRP